MGRGTPPSPMSLPRRKRTKRPARTCREGDEEEKYPRFLPGKARRPPRFSSSGLPAPPHHPLKGAAPSEIGCPVPPHRRHCPSPSTRHSGQHRERIFLFRSPSRPEVAVPPPARSTRPLPQRQDPPQKPGGEKERTAGPGEALFFTLHRANRAGKDHLL